MGKQKNYKAHSPDDCFSMGMNLYQSDNFQIQEVGVFLLGYSAHQNASALSFLRNTVSQHDSWKVQEILAMAFDNHCKIIGYEAALPLIKEWLNSDCVNVRRAVSEGLRIWTNRPYFKDNPQMISEELNSWDLSSKEIKQVYKLAGKFLDLG